MNTDKKIAIVCSGGGMRSAYSGGALVALAREYSFKNPDIVVASSGGAGNICYYLSGQFDSIHRIWEKLLSTPDFISFRRLRGIMDIDYLIDDVFKKQEPLDQEKFNQTKTDYYISVTDAITGMGRFISAKDGEDIFEVLRATKAMPFVYGKKVLLSGRQYIDGCLAVSFEDEVNKAIESGATHVIAINDSSDDFISLFFKKISKLFLFREKLFFKKNKINITDKKVITLRYKKGKILTIDGVILQNIFHQGYRDMMDNEEVRKLFTSVNTLV